MLRGRGIPVFVFCHGLNCNGSPKDEIKVACGYNSMVVIVRKENKTILKLILSQENIKDTKKLKKEYIKNNHTPTKCCWDWALQNRTNHQTTLARF